MVSNEVYEELKERKANKSFSELFRELLHRRKKTGKELYKCIGLLGKERNDKETKKAVEKGWKEWNKRYV